MLFAKDRKFATILALVPMWVLVLAILAYHLIQPRDLMQMGIRVPFVFMTIGVLGLLAVVTVVVKNSSIRIRLKLAQFWMAAIAFGAFEARWDYAVVPVRFRLFDLGQLMVWVGMAAATALLIQWKHRNQDPSESDKTVLYGCRLMVKVFVCTALAVVVMAVCGQLRHVTEAIGLGESLIESMLWGLWAVSCIVILKPKKKLPI